MSIRFRFRLWFPIARKIRILKNLMIMSWFSVLLNCGCTLQWIILEIYYMKNCTTLHYFLYECRALVNFVYLSFKSYAEVSHHNSEVAQMPTLSKKLSKKSSFVWWLILYAWWRTQTEQSKSLISMLPTNRHLSSNSLTSSQKRIIATRALRPKVKAVKQNKTTKIT